MVKRLLPAINRVLAEKIAPLPRGSYSPRVPQRIWSYDIGITSAWCGRLDIPETSEEHEFSFTSGKALTIPTTCGFYFSGKPLNLGCRNFSSEAGAKSGDGEADLSEGFSELEEPLDGHKIEESKSEDEQRSLTESLDIEGEISHSESDGEELSFLNSEIDDYKTKKGPVNSLLKAVLDAPNHKLSSALDKFVEEKGTLDRCDFSITMQSLRRRRNYGKALKLSEWVEAKQLFEFVENDYACQVDLIAKVQGPYKAEKYIEKIPEGSRGEVVYRTLLANCIAEGSIKRCEGVFNKMRDLGFPLTTFVCNQLLLLYKRVDLKKIADVLLMMENENVKPTSFTYRILIDAKGRSNDIEGMEKVVESMKAEGVEPDIYVQATIARYYIFGGYKSKAKAILKEMEGINVNENRAAIKVLLPLYASLNEAEDVGRLWSVCEPNPHAEECLAAIEAWGKLGRVEDAEAVFNRTTKTWSRLSSRYYTVLLRIYSQQKLLEKGKDLVRRMSSDGCKIGPPTWDALVKLYLSAGEVEKADSLLEKASEKTKLRPLYSSYLSVLGAYAVKGDIHNAEKVFHKMRTSGYTGRMRMYQILLEAYINAQAPAYGFRERMKADDLFPNNAVLTHLKTVDAFKKTEVSDLSA